MLPSLRKKKLMGVVSILSFGLTALFAVLDLGVLVPATFVLGFFILLPILGILGEDLPIVESESEVETPAVDTDTQTPIEQLRERYARGEVTESEFERRLERLLETEGADEGRTREREFE